MLQKSGKADGKTLFEVPVAVVGVKGVAGVPAVAAPPHAIHAFDSEHECGNPIGVRPVSELAEVTARVAFCLDLGQPVLLISKLVPVSDVLLFGCHASMFLVMWGRCSAQPP